MYGARPIRRWLEKNVVTVLSKMIVREEIAENSIVYIDVSAVKAGLVYRIGKTGGFVNKKSKNGCTKQKKKKSKNDEGHIVKKIKIEER